MHNTIKINVIIRMYFSYLFLILNIISMVNIPICSNIHFMHIICYSLTFSGTSISDYSCFILSRNFHNIKVPHCSSMDDGGWAMSNLSCQPYWNLVLA